MKKVAEAAERNKGPIYQALLRILRPEQSGRVLEISSGTGQHVAYLAPRFSNMQFQPTDVDQESLQSQQAYIADEKLSNVLPPLYLDAAQEQWPVDDDSFDLVVNINLIHISPWQVTKGLMRGASRALRAGGHLYMYGPYLVNGRPTTDSNAQFDQMLKSRNSDYGLRDIEAVKSEALLNNLHFVDMFDMPANNFSVIFRKQQSDGSSASSL